MDANTPTLGDFLRQYFSESDIATGVKRVDAAIDQVLCGLHPVLRVGLRNGPNGLRSFLLPAVSSQCWSSAARTLSWRGSSLICTSADYVASQRVTEIAGILAPRLAVPRGRKASAASIAHEFWLSNMGKLTGRMSYTWDEARGDFTDPLTRATRLAFGDPDF